MFFSPGIEPVRPAMGPLDLVHKITMHDLLPLRPCKVPLSGCDDLRTSMVPLRSFTGLLATQK